MPSKWLNWQRDRWKQKPVPDYVIDDDGTFYCDHGCKDLEEHERVKSGKETA